MKPDLILMSNIRDRLNRIEGSCCCCPRCADNCTGNETLREVRTNRVLQGSRIHGIVLIYINDMKIGATKPGEQGSFLHRAMTVTRDVNDERMFFPLQTTARQ